jgi:di/tricarboxylate transporter
MTLEIAFILALLVVAVALFATERWPVDLVALGIMTVLLASQIITPEEGIAGFSNTATVTVAAMFVLSAGLSQTGAVAVIGRLLTRAGKRHHLLAIFLTMLAGGVLSAFINNTAVVAIFMPVIIGVARSCGVSPSKMLMPLSFACILGGTSTLIGTSTNVLMNSIVQSYDQPPLRMFEFAPLGIALFAAGLVYMMTIGLRLIPSRRGGADRAATFEMRDYVTEIRLLPGADSAGKPLYKSPLSRDLNVAILEILRGESRISLPLPDTILRAGDVLRIRGDIEKMRTLSKRHGIEMMSASRKGEDELHSEDTTLVEAVVAPGSVLDHRTIRGIRFRNRFGGTVLAIQHQGRLLHDAIERLQLRGGDALLIEVKNTELERFKQSTAFVLVSEVDLPALRPGKLIPALAIMAGVVATAALGIFPIVVSAIMGSVFMVIARVVTLEEAYRAIEWKVIFLLAGVLTLGTALAKSGGAVLLSELLVKSIGAWGPLAALAALYLVASWLTEAVSNNATAALLAPVAIATAESLGVSTRPFIMAVAFAASASFMTPVGYQTNTLIYGPGQYRFSDFLRVGIPLDIICWLIAITLIPMIWPF